jgi:hypothetical protein
MTAKSGFDFACHLPVRSLAQLGTRCPHYGQAEGYAELAPLGARVPDPDCLFS